MMNRTNIGENKGYQKALEKITAEGIALCLDHENPHGFSSFRNFCSAINRKASNIQNEKQSIEYILKQKLHLI